MKNRAAVKSAKDSLAPFRKGQVWRIGDLNLAVTGVGKTLVHYKRYRTQSKGIPATLSSKPSLQQYLVNAKAVLVSE